MVAAGIDGINKKLKLTPECNAIAYGMEKESADVKALPKNLPDALAAFDADLDLKEALGTEFATVFKAVKQFEIDEFTKIEGNKEVVTDWERNM